MRITYATSAYVSDTPDDIIDKMEQTLSISAIGDTLVVVTKEAIEEFFNKYEKTMSDYDKASVRHLYAYLKNVIIEINPNNNIGDIFFAG